MMQRFARSLWLVALLGSAVFTAPAVGREDCEVRPPLTNGRSFVVDGRDVQAVARGWLPAAIQLDDAIAELSPREEAWLDGELRQDGRVQKALTSIELARQTAKRDTAGFRRHLQALADGKQDQISPVRRVLFLLDKLVDGDPPAYLTRLILSGELSRKAVFWARMSACEAPTKSADRLRWAQSGHRRCVNLDDLCNTLLT